MPKLVEERVFDYGIAQDADGNIIHNAMQQYDPIVRRRYDDGVIVLVGQRTGKRITPPFRVGQQGEYIPAENWEEPDAVQE